MNANKQDAGGLLPCPFCGQDVTDDEGCFPAGGACGGYYVRCGNPYCHSDLWDYTKDGVIAKWNRRNGEQCRAASVVSGDVPLAVIQAACDEYARVGKEQAGEAEYFPDAMEAAIKAALRALSRGVPEGSDSSAGAPCGGFRTKHGEHFDILYQAFTYASATDAKRLDWLAHHGASLRNDCQAEGGGWFVIAPYHIGISSVDGRARFATARAAIDAAMEGDE
ncbi:hypothetical protein ABIE51_001405 [Lysobacter sp. OAE881]|uniref:Lar family restriction alleviation protein n=1 Tax=Lysobacter sp. OAE881 TaxID=2663813 RepID=UPI00178BCE29